MPQGANIAVCTSSIRCSSPLCSTALGNSSFSLFPVNRKFIWACCVLRKTSARAWEYFLLWTLNKPPFFLPSVCACVFCQVAQPRPPKWLLSSRALRVWASGPPTPLLAPEWPLTSPPSFVVRSGAAVCPGRGQATQERCRVYTRLRPRRSLQARPMPPVHWVLLVCAGGHRAANTRDLHQVGGVAKLLPGYICGIVWPYS